jgi:prefoldin subunit 5
LSCPLNFSSWFVFLSFFLSFQRSESELQSENASYVSLFRAQTAATEEDLAIMKAQYAATQDLYEKRIRYLETRIANLKQKCKQGEQRRNLELEGYTNDVSGMRQKLRKLEHTLVQFKLAVQQAAQDEAAFATTSSSGSESGSAEAGSSTSRGRSASAAHLAQTQKRGGGRGGAKAGGGGGGGGLLPQRVAAQFAIMTDDVEKLQSELTSLARKISST